MASPHVWAAVEAVAAALLEHHTLGRKRLRAIIQASIQAHIQARIEAGKRV